MLTAEDVKAHNLLLSALPNLTQTEVVEFYRRARRDYEARRWGSEDCDEAEARSAILARELADRLAFEPFAAHDGKAP